MCFGDAVLTEMEDGGRKHGTRMALNHSVDQVLQRTHAAAGNHGNGNAVSNGPGQCKIIALPRAVAIHGRHQQFARPQSGQSRRMRQRIDSGCAPTAMSKDFPMTRSEEHTSELQSLMRISYAVFCLKKNKEKKQIKERCRA